MAVRMVRADRLRGGDVMLAETLQGTVARVRVEGILMESFSTGTGGVKVFTRDADFEYRADEMLQVERN